MTSTRAQSTSGIGGPVTSLWLAPATVTQVVSSPVSPWLAMERLDGEAEMELDLIAFSVVILRSVMQNTRA